MIEQLPIRMNGRDPQTALLPDALRCEQEAQNNGLPRIHGTLCANTPAQLTILLRIHNRAGIPVIEGRCDVRAGEQQFTFQTLRALGIEAYAHVSDVERANVQRRIWERAVYGTLTVEINGRSE